MIFRSGLLIGLAILIFSGDTALAQGATGGSLGNDSKTLSGSSPESRSAAPAQRESSERRAPRRQTAPRNRGEGTGGGGNFDGAWSISSVGTSGCSDTFTESFVVANGRMIGKDGSAPVTEDYPGSRPWAFTGGTIKSVTVDVSGEAYKDLELEMAAVFSRD